LQQLDDSLGIGLGGGYRLAGRRGTAVGAAEADRDRRGGTAGAAARLGLGGELAAPGVVDGPGADDLVVLAVGGGRAGRAAPGAVHAEQVDQVYLGHARPADPVIAQRVADRHPGVVGDDPGPLRGDVGDAGSQQQDGRRDHGQVVTALNGQVDPVADGEQQPYHPDHHGGRRAEDLRLFHPLRVSPP
jgi:hypothetical protein